MSGLTSRERANIKKRVTQINQQIQDPRLTIARCEELRTEREALAKQLLDDRAASNPFKAG